MISCNCEICQSENNYIAEYKTAQQLQEGYVPRTQKAKGLKVLKGFFKYAVPKFTIVPIEKAEPSFFIGNFVRPCPLTPRHGFVDSRTINTVEEATELINETLKADDKAEFLLMEHIDATFSGIWTEGRLAIGPGTDGATAGSKSKTLDVLGYPFRLDYWDNVLKTADIKESPYIELLWKDDDVKLVQLRDGPKQPTTLDFIPFEVEVKEIQSTCDLGGNPIPLLKWEELVKTFDPGTVIYHPGGNLSSHYSVHAILSKIPVIITREPKVGEKLSPNSEIYIPNIDRIKAGFVYGCNHEKLDYEKAAYIMLSGCHSVGKWMGRKDFLLGFAIGCMYRLIITASLGEARHRPDAKRKSGRSTVYQSVWKRILEPAVRARYLRAVTAFQKEGWSSGYGGQKWFEFSKYAGKIMDALLDEDPTKVLILFNEAVHAVHNGGWAFNKFVAEQDLNLAASDPAAVVIKCAPQLYEAMLVDESNDIGLFVEWFHKRKRFLFEEEIKEAEIKPPVCSCKDCSCDICYPTGCPGCGECEPNNDCDCEEHDCSTCYPDGCNCDCTDCHDCGDCSSCCNCGGDHDCSTCYPDGCDCSCSDCHDSGDECEECNPQEEPEPEPETESEPETKEVV